MTDQTMHVRIVPMTADHLDEVAELERICFSTPWSRNMLPDEKEKFISMPHEAYSGRHYHADMPIFVGPSFAAWLKNKLT